MKGLEVNVEHVYGFVPSDEIISLKDQADYHLKAIKEGSGKGSDFLGWLDLPVITGRNLLEQIEKEVKRLSELAKVFVVVGIGGSYLGARAVIEALSHHFHLLKNRKERPVVLYAGQNISQDYLADLLELLDQEDYAVVVISKSGTTTEPAIAFRLLKRHLESKYGRSKSKDRIIAITDKSQGALRKLASREGYSTYIIPDDVGGRYSVLSPVGLLPIALAGFDISRLLEGAGDMRKICLLTSRIEENPAALYAATRNVLFRKGMLIEILVNYSPGLFYFSEWWKQLFGESEGKEHKGIFPASMNFTTDLHSMGQYIQDGLRIVFETVLSVKQVSKKLTIPYDEDDPDGLNYISGREIQSVNQMAELATMLAHIEGGVPNIVVNIPEISEYYLGQLIFFFEMSCAMSGYMLGVNPFDQPGVEAYKKNMFTLLGKPGYEKQTELLFNKLKK